MKYRFLTVCLFCLVIFCGVSGCSNQPDTSSEVSQLTLSDKYSDISKRLVYLNDVAKNNVSDLIRLAFDYMPIDLPLREDYQNNYMHSVSDSFSTDFTVITNSYSGFDWTSNVGVIILQLENEEGTEFLTIKALFDESNMLVSSDAVASYSVNYDVPENLEKPAPAIEY